MSLFIIGSASRVTSNIVLQLAKNKQYSAITIADLLPSYDNYHRIYKLQKNLDNLNLNSTQLTIQKIFHQNQLYHHEHFDDVLFVTHDYYYHVTSKTKLMKMFAEVCKKRSHLYFATPVEYDHHDYSNPESNYLEAQNKVLQIAPQSTIIRSNVQDKTQAIAYINKNKSFIDSKLFNFYSGKNFNPKIVSSFNYAEIVAQNMKDRTQGKKIYVDGKKQMNPLEVDFERDIQAHEYAHAKQNIAKMTAKYNGLLGQGCETMLA